MNDKPTRIILESVAELERRADEERAERLRRGRWGVWRVVKSRQVLSILRGNPKSPYEIDLSDIYQDGPLHWLAHLREKTWLQRGDIEDLIALFDDVFGVSWLWDAYNGRKQKDGTRK